MKFLRLIFILQILCICTEITLYAQTEEKNNKASSTEKKKDEDNKEEDKKDDEGKKEKDKKDDEEKKDDVEPIRAGNFSLRSSQQPGPLVGFGENIIDKG